MNGFNNIFASDIDDQTSFDAVFTDDIEDMLINIVAGTDLYTESGDEIEFADMTGEDDEDEDDYSSTDNLEGEDDNDGDEEETEEVPDIEPTVINTTGDLDNYINKIPDENECPPCEKDPVDVSVNTVPDEIERVNVVTTSDLDKVILFDTTGDVGDTEEPEMIEDEACKKESIEESAKKKASKKAMTTADLDAAINGSSELKSDDLETPDEELIDDTESDDIDSVGESFLNLL